MHFHGLVMLSPLRTPDHSPTQLTNMGPSAPGGQGSELLQEAQHQVPQGGAHGLVVVADDVRGVRLQLDECVLRLQVQDVSVGRVFHLHLADAVLRGGSGVRCETADSFQDKNADE